MHIDALDHLVQAELRTGRHPHRRRVGAPYEGTGPILSVNVRDPDGNLIEIANRT